MEGEAQQHATTEQQPAWKWYAPLTHVTPLSHTLAALLFIALPFLGFWLGVGYGNSQHKMYALSDSDVVAEMRHKQCVAFNTGGRAGRCVENAPTYCSVVYYPPSCPTCQDGSGCGYVAEFEGSSPVRQQTSWFLPEMSG